MTRGPSRTVTRQDIYDVMLDRSGEPYSASELAESLPVSKDTVYNRLRELETLERIKTKKVGGRARIWWIPVDAVYSKDVTTGQNTKEGRILEQMASRSDPGDAWTTSELADKLGESANNLYHYMRDLENAGKVRSKRVGARAKVWWLHPAETSPITAG